MNSAGSRGSLAPRRSQEEGLCRPAESDDLGDSGVDLAAFPTITASYGDILGVDPRPLKKLGVSDFFVDPKQRDSYKRFTESAVALLGTATGKQVFEN